MYIELESVFNVEGESIQINYSFSLDYSEVATPVRVTGEVVNKTGIVTINAKARFDYSTSCDLCGKPLLRHATVPVKHILISRVENDDNDMYIAVDNMRLNLDTLVEEDINLSVPSRFLCKPDCKGLCMMCGADLNDGPCSCKKPTDSRWDALKNFTIE